MLLYYITDRTQFPGNGAEQSRALLAKIGEAARASVDYIQLREKDLSARELERLACEAVAIVRENSNHSRILVNSRADVAITARADGVHLRSDDISISDVRSIWKQCNAVSPLIGISCHLPADVVRAEVEGADFAVFGPVFEKNGSVPAGVAALREAGRVKIPVLALGGITVEDGFDCLEAGAAGIAGIRLFQENDIQSVVRRLRIRA